MGHNSNTELNKLDTDLDLLLKTKFTSNFRPGYITYKDHTLPERYNELQKAIDEFEVFDDDVWICSFPKTGTTWSQEMVWLIGNDLNYVAAEENLGARFPFLEVSMVFDWRKLQAENVDFIPPIFLDDSLKFVRERKRPRFIKSHLPWELLPKQIRNEEKHPRIIYITRNPKEVCVSYFHHSRLLEGFRGSFDEFLELFLKGKVIFGPFWNNVLPFWQKRNQENFHFIKYEDMKHKLGEVIDGVSDFLNKSFTDEEKTQLLNHLSFESMKANPAVNYEPIIDFHRRHNLIHVDGVFMRSGSKENNMSKIEISSETELLMNAWIKENDPENDLMYYLNY